MKKLDNDKPLILLGDHHGNWSELFYLIDKNKLENCYLISVGDLGIGFESKERQLQTMTKLNHLFKENNIYFKGIRGNHDDPDYFKDVNYGLEYFELIEDYSVYEYNSKLIQFIGGAISIDRTGRRLNVSYWQNEGLNFQKNKCKKVDVLITHTAPSFCFPQSFNEIVYGWAGEDEFLLKELTQERKDMDKIFKICDPSWHFYGHFHSSTYEKINNCLHKLLNINELYEFKI
jgi:hypothetical protein